MKAWLNKAARSWASTSDFPVSVAKRIVALTREAMTLRINMEAKSTILWGQTDRQIDVVLSQLPEENGKETALGMVGGSILHFSLAGGPCTP